MRFVVDENLSIDTVLLLAGLGHDAVRVKGLSDQEIAAGAKTTSAVIVTRDRDFANLQSMPLATHAGIILLRPRQPASLLAVNGLLRRLLSHIDVDRLSNALTIVSEHDYRVVSAAGTERAPLFGSS